MRVDSISPDQTDFSKTIRMLSAGSQYEMSVEPCRDPDLCGPPATVTVDTEEKGEREYKSFVCVCQIGKLETM